MTGKEMVDRLISLTIDAEKEDQYGDHDARLDRLSTAIAELIDVAANCWEQKRDCFECSQVRNALARCEEEMKR